MCNVMLYHVMLQVCCVVRCIGIDTRRGCLTTQSILKSVRASQHSPTVRMIIPMLTADLISYQTIQYRIIG
jgi:hypothetical protein